MKSLGSVSVVHEVAARGHLKTSIRFVRGAARLLRAGDCRAAFDELDHAYRNLAVADAEVRHVREVRVARRRRLIKAIRKVSIAADRLRFQFRRNCIED